MPNSTPLQRFVDDELDRSVALIERCHAGTLHLLRDTRELSGSERAHHFQLVEVLQQNGARWQEAFVRALQERVREELTGPTGGVAPSIGPAGDLGGLAGLELMDESRVEEDIEISRAAQLIDGSAEWELRELQTFTSTLIGLAHVTAESNPLRPLVYAGALWQAACAVASAPAQRATLLRVSAGVMAGLLKMAWAAACTRLEAQGVEPGIYRTVLLTPGGTGQAPAVDVTRPGALGGLLASMPVGAADPSPPALHAAMADPAFEQALQRLEELVQAWPIEAASTISPGLTPGDTGMPAISLPVKARQGTGLSRRRGEHRRALAAQVGGAHHRQIVELVLRMFETMGSDEHLRADFRPLIVRLQVPALRLALGDPALMESHAHPLWQLLDCIGHASAGYSQAGDPRASGLRLFCEAVVDEVTHATAPDTALMRRNLMRVQGFLGELLQRQLREAQVTALALGQAERRDALEQQLTQRLSEQVASVRTTPSIRRFITGPWAKVLAEAMIRHGNPAEPTSSYLKTVDDLIWSLQLPDHPQSRQRLLGLLPAMLSQLRAGMASIGLPAPEQQSVLDELMSIHTEALRPGGRGSGHAPSPQEILQRMRDEVVPETPMQRPFGDSVIDLQSMDTVPAELLGDRPGAAPSPAVQDIDTWHGGERRRLFLQGRWMRLQLLWHSERGGFYLFAGETPGRTHSVTRRALDRLNAAGLVQPLETAPLVQRAVDTLMRQLSLSA
jgi:hypothetical protein